VKVSLPLCVCLAAVCAQLLGCGSAADISEQRLAQTNGAEDNDSVSAVAPTASDTMLGDAPESAAAGSADDESGCADACTQPSNCGQICLTLKGKGSSCQLVPTANDLTRPPRAVRFDCAEIPRGPNGYDFDALGHITLMGDTCAALTKGGPHHVTLTLSCPPP
jgi:hypothetical protein